MPGEYLMSYNFHVIMGEVDFRVSKIRGVERSVELEEFVEGGYGRRILAKPPSTLPKLLLERGYCAKDGAADAYRLIGVPHPDTAMQILVYDRTNTAVQKTYKVNDWMVTKWNVGNLDAMSNTILLETVEVVYTTLSVEG